MDQDRSRRWPLRQCLLSSSPLRTPAPCGNGHHSRSSRAGDRRRQPRTQTPPEAERSVGGCDPWRREQLHRWCPVHGDGARSARGSSRRDRAVECVPTGWRLARSRCRLGRLDRPRHCVLRLCHASASLLPAALRTLRIPIRLPRPDPESPHVSDTPGRGGID